MAILFSPPRGETALIKVPTHSTSTVQLHFTASFGSQDDYDTAQRDGVRVELWTDIPDEDHGKGGWRAIHFQDSGSNVVKDSDESFSFQPKASTSTSKVLHIQTSVRFSGRQRYGYTHRLVYPSGEVKWLGDYGRDGVLIVEHGDPRFVQGKEILEAPESEQTIFSDQGWKNSELGQLSPDFDWSVCGIQENGFAQVHSLSDEVLPTKASLAYFVPVLRAKSLVIPPVFSLAVPPGSSLSINAHGSVLITGPAGSSTLFQNHFADSDQVSRKTAIQKSLSFCSLEESYQVLDLDCDIGSNAAVILTSLEASYPKVASVIPFTITLWEAAHIRAQTLSTLLPPGTSELSLFAQATLKSRFLTLLPEEQPDAALNLTVGPGCGQFIIAPVYDIGQHETDWQASVLTKHQFVKAESDQENRLPTPPPSPYIRPVERRRLASPSPERLAEDSKATEEATITEKGPPLALTIRPRGSASLTKYILYIISLSGWLFKFWLLRVWLFFRARRVSDEAVELLSEGDEEEEEEEEIDEEVDEGTVVWEGLETLAEEDALSISTAANADAKAELVEEPSSTLLLDVPAGSLSILLRAVTTSQTLKDFQIELDGKPLASSVKALGEGIFSVDVEGSMNGGRVSISVL